MTQILRPVTETTNDGFYFDPTLHPASVVVSPPGGNEFPFTSGGWWYSSSLPAGQVSPFGVNGQIINPWATNSNSNILVQQYHTGFKALAAPASVQGMNTKTVIYGSFPTLTDSWANGLLSVVCGYNAIAALKTDDTVPVMNLEYSTDNGSTWTSITSLSWPTTSDNTGLSGGLYWCYLVETLGPNTVISHGTSLPNGSVQPWWGITSGNQYDTTIPGISALEVANILVRFTLSGGYVLPVGYPYTANGAPYYVGTGWQIADVSLTDAATVAVPPNSATGTTGVSGPANAVTVTTGPGAYGQSDLDWQVATMTGNVVTGTYIPAKVMQPNAFWGTIAGTTWVNAGDGPTPSTSATPTGGLNTRYRYQTTFLLPSNFSTASLNLALLCSDYSPRIALNGNVIGTQSAITNNAPNSNPVAPPATFAASTGFVTGTNILEIDVQNGGDWTGLDVLAQVDYQLSSSSLSGSGITTPSTTVELVAVGGTAPYGFSIVYSDPQTTLPDPTSNASIVSIGGQPYLQIDGSYVPAGTYTIRVHVVDTAGNSNDQIVPVNVLSNTKFNILNESIAIVPTSFPYTASLELEQYGGSGSVTWNVLPASTTVASALVEEAALSYTVNGFGTYHIGLVAVDSLGNTTSKIIAIIATSDTGYKLVDGQIEILFVDEAGIKTGSHQFNIGLLDSASNTSTRTYNYLLNTTDSVIAPVPYAINKYWATSDTTPYNFQISGSQSGVVIGTSPAVTLANGLTVYVDGPSKFIEISGPPVNSINAIANVKIPLIRASQVIGTINRSYVTVPYAGNNLENLGANTVQTVPAVVGDFFTLNVQKPYFNSPDNDRDATWYVRVQAGSSLPTGLSLDRNTGLIYGPVESANTSPGIIEFVNKSGVVVGTFTINFNFFASDYTLIESLPIGKLGSVYNGFITSTSTDALTTGSVIYGNMPAGLTITTSGNTLLVTGTPTEAGYFDFWVNSISSTGKKGYVYKRLEVTFIAPIAITSTTIPSVISTQSYSKQLTAVGGVGGYTWSIASGTLPSGITLSPTGLLSGISSNVGYAQSITFTVTDSDGNTINQAIQVTVESALTILNASPLPNVELNVPYSLSLLAQGGTGTGYTWGVSPSLPTGLSLNTSTGVISGTVVGSTFPVPASVLYGITITVTDSGSNTDSSPFNLSVVPKPPPLGIDVSGVGPISRGANYSATLKATGTGILPYTWLFSNPASTPPGLQINANPVDQGGTAFISGATTAVLTNVSVEVTLADSAGGLVNGYVILTSVPSVEILTPGPSLPQGQVGSNYSFNLSGTSANLPLTWATTTPLPPGMSMNSAGTITAGNITASTGTYNVTFQLTDGIADTATATFSIQIVNTTLAITTASLPIIPNGQPFSTTLVATGGSRTGYIWECSDPASGGLLANGWTVTVAATGTLDTTGATGSYTVSATGGSGVYSGTGLFPWSALTGTVPAVSGLTKTLFYNYIGTVQVTDTITNQTIRGVINIPFQLSPTDTLPKTITSSQTFTNSCNLASVLPTGVSFSENGVLATTGTTAIFNQPVEFTVTDSNGATVSATLNLQVQTITPLGALQTGPDYINGTQTSYLGAISLVPGDIQAINPRPNQSFYIYGSVPVGVTASQLQVTTTVNSNTGAYSNMVGVVDSISSTGIVIIKLVFEGLKNGYMTNAPLGIQSNSVDITLINTASGAKAVGTFSFQTINPGVLTLLQGFLAALPTY